MISVEEALTRILTAFRPLPAETVGLSEALGRVLAEDVVARMTQPPRAVSAMDGYALRAEDVTSVPAVLMQIGEAPAGKAFAGEIGPGETVRIFTGGPLPEGADSVVIQEETEAAGTNITIKDAPRKGQYVRPAGLDFKLGDIGVEAGHLLSARDIGLAAAMNLPWLKVRRRPRVAILATGDEVVMPGDPLGPDQIVSSNGPSLAAFVTACGGAPINLGIALDSEESLGGLVEGARGADLLITSGGASVGKHDLVRQVLDQHGLALDFWKIAMRPGKPLMFGKMGDTPVLGLPGNPVSSLVCALLFVRPVIDRLLGREDQEGGPETAILKTDLAANDQRQDYLRARLSHDAQGRRLAQPFTRQDSAMLAALAHADCLIVRPPHEPATLAGETVEIIRLGGGCHSV